MTYSTRAASPSTSVKYLGPNGQYKSDLFSGSGWRFSNWYFLSTAGTGDALYWVSVNDGGRVGNFSEAYDTLHGKLSGMELPANTGRYCWTLNGQQYYTYNPLPNTYYIVVNK